MGFLDKFRNKNADVARPYGVVRDLPKPSRTAFQIFLDSRANTAWVSAYITEHNEVNNRKAYHDMSEGGTQISDYSEDAFRRLVGTLYARYMGVQRPEESELHLLDRIDKMPLNITIRRVKPKASGNNWSVQYLGGTKYYGTSLIHAIDRLIERNPKVAAKFVQDEGSVEEK